MLPLAITMGCPGGIGPEIILKLFTRHHNNQRSPAIVVGDKNVLEFYAAKLKIVCSIVSWSPGDTVPAGDNIIPVCETSSLAANSILPGRFNKDTAIAMADAIITAVKGVQKSYFSGICTCPISKEALQKSGHHFPGHTEMLAELTSSSNHVMMLAGTSLRVTLATIHCGIAQVPDLLSHESLLKLYRTTYNSLQIDFGIPEPRIAVAALNPHGGENGMFGNEEEKIIIPSMKKAEDESIILHGPFPPDTVFLKASRGEFDAVICMYHDQGLIPLKLLHFKDGVNITLGLPIVRTSVDHGTAYDIAGRGLADTTSLAVAVDLANTIIQNRNTYGGASCQAAKKDC